MIKSKKYQSNISCIWWQGRDDSALCLPEHGLSVDFIQRKTNLKTNKVLVKPSFNKGEWITDWSDLMITVLQVIYPLH